MGILWKTTQNVVSHRIPTSPLLYDEATDHDDRSTQANRPQNRIRAQLRP